MSEILILQEYINIYLLGVMCYAVINLYLLHYFHPALWLKVQFLLLELESSLRARTWLTLSVRSWFDTEDGISFTTLDISRC